MREDFKKMVIAIMENPNTVIQTKAGVDSQWKYWSSGASAATWMIHNPNSSLNIEFRIKPEPVPDKVTYGYLVDYNTLEQAKQWSRGANLYRRTIKTDENGVKTETVEIV